MTPVIALGGAAVTAWLLARLTRRPGTRVAARYRWAIVGGIAVLPAVLLASRASGDATPLTADGIGPSLFLAIFGALLGAFLASGAEFGFVENSFPPAAEVRLEVVERHKARFGHLPPLRPAKRLFDIVMSLVALTLSAPIWIAIAVLIWLEDPGPVVFVKNSVGRGGRTFAQLKYRTMVRNAEDSTGPIPARLEDERVLGVGRFLRRTALDELPQLVNILAGQMSFVGPRPLRTVVERDYLRDLPEFADRHKVQPGLAGLAQVVATYYVPLRSRLRLDRLYAEKASLLFDIKLIGLAVLVVFWLRWQPGWNGRLPRRWLHGRSRAGRAEV